VTDRLSIGVAGGRSARDGFTVNPISGMARSRNLYKYDFLDLAHG
jgi:hypothetical protein